MNRKRRAQDTSPEKRIANALDRKAEESPSVGPVELELKNRMVATADEMGRLGNMIKEFVDGGDYSGIGGIRPLKVLYAELAECLSWLSPPLSVMSDAKRKEVLHPASTAWLAEGHIPLETVEYLQNAQRKPRGRPATKRHLAVVALDKWLTTKLSWPQVTRKVCECGRSDHGNSCQEALRQQVNDLRAALKKLGIKVPARHKRKAV